MDAKQTTWRPLRVILGVVLISGACLNLVYCICVLLLPKLPCSDFLAFWSYAQFTSGHDLGDIYNGTKLQLFQDSLFPGFTGAYPLLYPPMMLVLVCWMKYFSYAIAEAIWTVSGLTALISAAWMFFPKNHRLVAVALLLASPTALINGLDGNSGFFTAAILMAGFAMLPARPLLAGMMLGLLAVKPHLAVLLPVALLGGQHWRAVCGAGITVLTLAALSCLMFPGFLWGDWLHAISGFQTGYFSAQTAGATPPGLQLFVTIMANLVMLGVPNGIAALVQGISTLTVAIATFLLWRHGPYNLAVAGLFAGMFLVSPHAYIYDTMPVLAATGIAMLSARTLPALSALGLILYIAPLMVLTQANHLFYYAAPEALLYLFVLRLAFATPAREIPEYEPNTN